MAAKPLKLLLCAALALAVGAPGASAQIAGTPLLQGSGTVPVITTYTPTTFSAYVTTLNPQTLIDTYHGTSANGGTLADGNLVSTHFTEWVYQDNNTGYLSFAWQVTNDSTSSDGLISTSLNPFKGFTTDVSMVVDAGLVVPTDAQRPSSTVDFDYSNSGFGTIDPGSTSAIMIIATNARFYKLTPSAYGAFDGGGQFAAALAPTVPEAGTVVGLGSLLVLGSLGLLRTRHHRKVSVIV